MTRVRKESRKLLRFESDVVYCFGTKATRMNKAAGICWEINCFKPLVPLPEQLLF